jgi:hypothetical protein
LGGTEDGLQGRRREVAAREHALVVRRLLESAVDDAVRDEAGRGLHQRGEPWNVQEGCHDAREGINVEYPARRRG